MYIYSMIHLLESSDSDVYFRKYQPQKAWNKSINKKLYAWAKKLTTEDNWLRNLNLYQQI